MKNRKKRLKTKKATTRLKIGILKAKWLQKLKQKEDIAILPKFKERYIKSCYKVALKRYHKKDKLMMLTIIY